MVYRHDKPPGMLEEEDMNLQILHGLSAYLTMDRNFCIA